MKTITIENRVGKVSLNDTVTPATITQIIEEIGRIYGREYAENHATFGEITCKADDALETLNIQIHSPGGSVMDGYRAYHAIKEMRGRGVRVVATVNTLAASMASVIAMAADEVQIVKGGRMMIHEASQGITGTAEDHARAAKNLDEISADIAAIYAEKTGKDAGEMRELMKKETWMGAEDSVTAGFADKVISPGSVETVRKAESDTTMGLFTKPNTDAQAAITALESENAELREQFTALQSAASESTEQVVVLRSEISAVTAERDEVVANLAAAAMTITDHEAKISAANEKLATFDTEVAAKVQLQVASLGFKGTIPGTTEEAGNTVSLREQINAIPDAKKRQEARLKNWDKL